MSRPKKPPNLWFPTLLQTANGINIESHSWFNIKTVDNTDKNNLTKQTINTSFLKTKKYIIYPDNNQHQILQKWHHNVISIYNITNKYLKSYYQSNQKIESFFEVRKNLKSETDKLVSLTKINKHILDYSIKHCIEMYKSAISNLKNKNIKQFDIKDISHFKNRFNLVLEPGNFSKVKNGFCISQLGQMKYDRNLNKIIHHNSILQFNKNKNKYYLIVPTDSKLNVTLEREEKCGIDLGIRTFATVYSKNETIEMGSNLASKIDLYNKRIDKLRRDVDHNCISKERFSKLVNKYGSKMRNCIDDLHKKVSVYLSKKFDIINIGKISTKNIISNLKCNISDKVKRYITTLSFYSFLERLKIIGKKYNCEINLINEYKTTMTCHHCLNEKLDIGSNKIYNCANCKIIIDRDINSAINMFNGGFV
jgi:putative transposase